MRKAAGVTLYKKKLAKLSHLLYRYILEVEIQIETALFIHWTIKTLKCVQAEIFILNFILLLLDTRYENLVMELTNSHHLIHIDVDG